MVYCFICLDTRKEEPLGKGGFGVVYLYTSNSDSSEAVVVKSVNLSGRNKSRIDDSILAETQIPRNLNNTYLVKVLDSYIDGDERSGYHMNSIMEYCDNGSLEDVIRDLNEKKAKIEPYVC